MSNKIYYLRFNDGCCRHNADIIKAAFVCSFSMLVCITLSKTENPSFFTNSARLASASRVKPKNRTFRIPRCFQIAYTNRQHTNNTITNQNLIMLFRVSQFRFLANYFAKFFWSSWSLTRVHFTAPYLNPHSHRPTGNRLNGLRNKKLYPYSNDSTSHTKYFSYLAIHPIE